MIRSSVLPALALVGAGVVGCGTGRTSQWEATPGPAPAAAPAPSGAGAAGDPMAEAEAAWGRRGERPQLERAISLWETAVAQRPDDAATLARLARAYHLLADGFLRQPATKAAYLAATEKGTGYGERALAAVSPSFKSQMKEGAKVEEAIKAVGREGLEAMYWYAVNLGKWSRAKGLAALLGNKDRVFGVMSRAVELDEGFFHAAPHRYFGVYWALLPVGRDLDKSRQHFEKSLALAPGYAGTKVLMAESYAVKRQDRALFEKLLGEVLAMPDDAIAGLEAEARFEKEKARELKARTDDLF